MNEIALRQEMPMVSFQEASQIGKVFAESGYFKDAADVAKAITKILAGQELGLGPMQSMTGIHVVDGKPTLSAGLVGALIKRSGRYDYRVRHLDEKSCTLDFFERGEKLGDSEFTWADAVKAKLDQPRGGKPSVWTVYPKNMLFARALTNGARFYCPDVFGGAVYTPDELGAVIDGATGEMLDEPDAMVDASQPEPEIASGETVAAIDELAAELMAAGAFTAAMFDKALRKDYGTSDTAALTVGQAAALLSRLEAARDALPAEAVS